MSAATKSVKLVVIGDDVREDTGGYTKTTLLISYASNRYPEEYIPTVFDNYTVNLTVGQDAIELGLWDTRGSEYDRLGPLSYANTNIFIVLFSVVNPKSYENVSSKWIPELIHFCPDVPGILVGCQIELRDNEKMLEKLKKQGEKPITQAQGHRLARKIKAVKYIECSARTGENLDIVFHEAVKAALFSAKTAPKSSILASLFSEWSLFNKKITSETSLIRRTDSVLATNHTKGISSSTVTKSIKLVVVGDGSVGKTEFLYSYVNDGPPKDYTPAVFCNCSVNIIFGQDIIELGLWNTTGEEEYERLRPLSYANANIFLVLFSVMNPVSYENIHVKWIPELRHFCPNVPIIIVGCKIELRDKGNALEKLKNQDLGVITYEKAYKLSKKIRAMRYMECSAKTGEGLKEVFNEAVKVALFSAKTEPKSGILASIFSEESLFNKKITPETLPVQEKDKDSVLATNHTKDISSGTVTKSIKLVVVGDNVSEGKGTAKTSLLMSYANNRYPSDNSKHCTVKSLQI